MTFSLCMIVKNEEKSLAACLDSLKDIMDEIIIVDTGSTDSTKAIAGLYTDKVYDFEWVDDFSKARNFAFSKATGDYIYSADADETLDAINQDKLLKLKQALLPEVEIVQMIYVTMAGNHPTENFTRDYRPKLFKRVRSFTWIDPIHETVNTNPVVYDSDIEIIHTPVGDHSGRDFKTFERALEKNGAISKRLLEMYLRELYKAGKKEDLEKAKDYLCKVLQENTGIDKQELCRKIIVVLLKYYRLVDDNLKLLKLALMEEATIPNAEICMELGYYFYGKLDYEEGLSWFLKATMGVESELDIKSSGENAYLAIAESYRKLGALDKAAEYEAIAKEWKPFSLGV